MKDDKPKQLLPEVLPDPTRAEGQGGPRQRTLSRMQRLVAAAATGATLGACSKSDSPTKSLHDPGSATIAVAPTPPPADSGPAPTTPSATAPTSHPESYARADPIPPPATCAGLARSIKASAHWKGSNIRVELGKPGMRGATYTTGQKPRAYNAPLKRHRITAHGVSLELGLPVGPTSISVILAASCPRGPETLRITVVASGGALKPGTPLEAVVADGY